MMHEFKTTYIDYSGEMRTDVVTVFQSERDDSKLIITAGYGGQGDTDGFMDIAAVCGLYEFLGQWLEGKQ